MKQFLSLTFIYYKKRNLLYFYILLFIFTCKTIYAQDSLYNNHSKYLSLAFGGGVNSFGLNSCANLSYHLRTNSLSIGYIKSNEVDNKDNSSNLFPNTLLPPEAVWEMNICFNHTVFDTTRFKTEIGGGINFAQGIFRGNYLYETSAILGGTKYYQADNFTVIGVNVNFIETLKLKNNFSLELTAFANFNPVKSYFGAFFSVVYSYPFTNK